MVLKAFASLDYLCVTHHDQLLSHLPCFQRSHTAVKTQCNPRCGDLERLKALQKQQQVAQLLRDLDKMTETMGTSLRVRPVFLSCALRRC